MEGRGRHDQCQIEMNNSDDFSVTSSAAASAVSIWFENWGVVGPKSSTKKVRSTGFMVSFRDIFS